MWNHISRFIFIHFYLACGFEAFLFSVSFPDKEKSTSWLYIQFSKPTILKKLIPSYLAEIYHCAMKRKINSLLSEAYWWNDTFRFEEGESCPTQRPYIMSRPINIQERRHFCQDSWICFDTVKTSQQFPLKAHTTTFPPTMDVLRKPTASLERNMWQS